MEVHIEMPGAEEERKEIIVAGLSEAGFESFLDSDTGFFTYIPLKNYNSQALQSLAAKHSFTFTEKEIPSQNWNAVWESNFEPVVIDEKCLIRAGFHENLPSYPYEIWIDPKMSFGTGHHETTSLMVSSMMEMDFSGKRVLDMGCGTGILAIMASKLGAHSVWGIDIDEWSFENSVENAARNGIHNIQFKIGDVSLLKEVQVDIVLANINRNVLLSDICHYAVCLPANGYMLLSGFYRQDVDMITAEAQKNSFECVSLKEKNNWVAALFVKK